MAFVYGFIGFNALFMFIGTWRYKWRVCSVYFTFFACLFQFIAQLTIGAMLLTKYNAVCARSLTQTAGSSPWTMSDDFYVTFVVWIMSFAWMFIFMCCGMCSAYNPNYDKFA